ncbi:VOC family protein [Cytobacillus firmus]|uniref:VOC family protein n=1 Tax=Cytobacillus firmus TaxID=1399 RepID=UPI0018CE874B|nr:hypothetical protein [Cytobacillus firmus]MBG9587211.1 hypothetical protein [Cytobacillus firmus]
MRINEVDFQTYHLKEMRDFYNKTLLMPIVRESKYSFTVQAGQTLLSFHKINKKPFYHFAIKIESNSFHYMLKKIQNSSMLIPNLDGNTIIPSDFWKVNDRIYFYDPDKNIVEIISHKLTNISSMWVNVCEVGLPTGNVKDLSKYLTSIKTNIKEGSEQFQFYGDFDGIFVLVKEGRKWYPTTRSAEIHKIEVIVEGPYQQILQHPELPYKIELVTNRST